MGVQKCALWLLRVRVHCMLMILRLAWDYLRQQIMSRISSELLGAVLGVSAPAGRSAAAVPICITISQTRPASGSLGEQSQSHRHGRGDPSDPTCWYWPSCPLVDFRHAFRNDWHHEFTQSSMMIVQMISETDVLHWLHCLTLEWSKKFNGFCEC